MARKTNRRAASRTRRAGGRSGTATAPKPQAPASPSQAPAVGGGQAFIRSVEMSLAPGAAAARRPGGRGRGGRVVLETADPAIPLDRVPYFLGDLARLGIVAGFMVALLVLAAFFVIPLVIR